MSQQPLSQQSVIITGASSGIGKATAERFAAAGFRVFGTSRRTRASDGRIAMLELDVRSRESIRRCVAEVLSRVGRIDVLINNAGIEHVGIAEETSEKEAHAVFETNFFGAVQMTNAVLPHMRAARSGRIVNVGSLAAWVGEPGEAFYAASKRALAGYTEAVRHEVWPFGIEVSLIEPGAFRTNIVPAALVDDGPIRDYDSVRKAAHRTLQESLRRGGDPRKVANVLLAVATSRTPRLRYWVGSGGRWIPILRVLLPQRLFDRLVRRGFGLTRDLGGAV